MTMRPVLSGVLLFAVLAALPPGGTFIDDDGSTHEGSIEAIAEAGITKGCNPPSNNRFCPHDVVNRGQMAAFISRALDLPAATDRFVDDDGHLFETDIDRLAAAGITRGCNPPANDRFCPDDNVTRDQMASFLARALGLQALVPPPRVRPLVVVTPREDWGARPAETSRMTPHTVERLTVHHAGTQSGTTGPAQFRGWQDWHMDGQGWPDIAYHLIVGIDGEVYEGRDPAYQGDTATTYDTNGHFLVVVEGNFDIEEPTAAQIESLTRVLAWASEEYGVPPDTIAGHRDYAATTCPGDHLYAMIQSGQLANSVQDLIDDGGVDLLWP